MFYLIVEDSGKKACLVKLLAGREHHLSLSVAATDVRIVEINYTKVLHTASRVKKGSVRKKNDNTRTIIAFMLITIVYNA